jgi:hypothetical protein
VITATNADSYGQYDNVPLADEGVSWGLAGAAITVGAALNWDSAAGKWTTAAVSGAVIRGSGCRSRHRGAGGRHLQGAAAPPRPKGGLTDVHADERRAAGTFGFVVHQALRDQRAGLQMKFPDLDFGRLVYVDSSSAPEWTPGIITFISSIRRQGRLVLGCREGRSARPT